ncbi:DedA family protein [Providencia rustigianii]|uniref:DedA family protein n=1 Tax=Providencia rustigianii TaxID=158850 RepID=UPI002240CB20|nr:DedA family protein [Providencia rustigianii]
MADELTRWLIEYGYWAVFLGSMIEGETAAFLSGIAAHKQWLSYPLTMLFAALGGVVSDNVLFFVGRFAGARILPRCQKHQAKIERVQQLIQSHENWIIIGIRFAYGMRTIGPIIIGASKVNPIKFFILNVIGGIIWGCSIVSIGYFISSIVFALPFHPHLSWLVIGLVIVGLAILIRKKWRR